VGGGRGEGWLRPLLVLVAILAFLHPAHATERDIKLANLAVTVWEPAAPPPGPRPVVMFSHGFHGCATQTRFLMRALSDAGYIVFAPNHADAVCHGGTSSWIGRPEAAFVHPETWTDATYRDRADDISFLLTTLRADPAWRDKLDFSRLALCGHSLGGYTVLALAGAWPSWRLPGVRAVLAMSPYAQPFLNSHALAGLEAPVMYQGGTLDFGITPFVDKVGGAYDLSSSPKYFVKFSGATHFAWTDFGLRGHAGIVAYALAFFDHALNGAPEPDLHRKLAGVAELRVAEP
jgi:predicted dienelactone hydrolase